MSWFKCFQALERDLKWYFERENTKVSFIKKGENTLLTSYFLEIDKDTVFWGGLYSKLIINLWFWFLQEKLKELWENKNIECTVIYEIEWKENKGYKALLRKYKWYWFELGNKWEKDNYKYIKLRREKSNKN